MKFKKKKNKKNEQEIYVHSVGLCFSLLTRHKNKRSMKIRKKTLFFTCAVAVYILATIYFYSTTEKKTDIIYITLCMLNVAAQIMLIYMYW